MRNHGLLHCTTRVASSRVHYDCRYSWLPETSGDVGDREPKMPQAYAQWTLCQAFLLHASHVLKKIIARRCSWSLSTERELDRLVQYNVEVKSMCETGNRHML